MEGKRVWMTFPIHGSERNPLSSIYGHYPSCCILAHAFKNRCLSQLYFSSFTERSLEGGKCIFWCFCYCFVLSSSTTRFGSRNCEEQWLERVSRLLLYLFFTISMIQALSIVVKKRFHSECNPVKIILKIYVIFQIISI